MKPVPICVENGDNKVGISKVSYLGLKNGFGVKENGSGVKENGSGVKENGSGVKEN